MKEVLRPHRTRGSSLFDKCLSVSRQFSLAGYEMEERKVVEKSQTD